MSGLLWRIRRGLRVRAARWLGLEPTEVPLASLRDEDLVALRRHFARPKFFIIGYPRSGTTLLARLLRLHPQVHCSWQGHFASGEGDWISLWARSDLMAWLGRPSNRWSSGEEMAPAVIRAAADWILEREAAEQNAHWVGDKTPMARGDRAVARLALLYPDAHLIAIVRDGRDAALSQRFQAFIDQPETLRPADLRLRSALTQERAAFGPGGRSLFTGRWLDRVASDWAATVQAGHRAAVDGYGPKYRALRFEDLLADPWTETVTLWQFLGVEEVPPELGDEVAAAMARNPAAAWHSEAAPQLVGSLERGASGSWRSWFTRSDLARFDRLAGKALRAWRYPLEGSE